MPPPLVLSRALSSWLRLACPGCLLCLVALAAGPVAAADGELDPGFGSLLPGIGYLPPPTDVANAMRASAVALDSQDRVLLAGDAFTYIAQSPFRLPRLVRMNRFGHYQPGFQPAGLPTMTEGWLTAVATLANGDTVVAGTVRTATGFHPYIARFADDGAMVCSRTQVLGAAGSPVPAQAHALAVLADGRWMVAGAASGDMFWARFHPNCTLDASYGLGGARIVGMEALAGGPSQEYASAMVVAPNGRIYTAASSNLGRGGNYDMLVFCEEANGSSCLNWFLGFASIAFDRPNSTSKDDRATAIALDRQGRVLVAGYANFAGLDDDFAIARLLPANGAKDPTFASSGLATVAFDLGGSGADRANGLAVQSDDRIVLAGSARGAGNDSEFAFARLTATGAFDSTFGPNGKRVHGTQYTDPWDEVWAMVLSGGRILAAGRGRGSTSQSGGGMAVVRLQSDLIFTNGLQ